MSFNAFKRVIAAGGVVRGIPAPGAAAQPRSFFDKLVEWARSDMGAPGLGYIVFEADGGKGPIAKFIPAEVQARIMAKAGIASGDAVFFAADQPAAAARLAGAARSRIAEELGLIDKDRFEFCWIVDFPMYEWNEEEKKIDFSHNPFSMPNLAVEEFLALDPADHEKILAIKAIQYDIVCNGTELSSGAIRNHRPDVMTQGLRHRRLRRERAGAEIRRHAARAVARGAAARRHRARHRPHRDAARAAKRTCARSCCSR